MRIGKGGGGEKGGFRWRPRKAFVCTRVPCLPIGIDTRVQQGSASAAAMVYCYSNASAPFQSTLDPGHFVLIQSSSGGTRLAKGAGGVGGGEE